MMIIKFIYLLTVFLSLGYSLENLFARGEHFMYSINDR